MRLLVKHATGPVSGELLIPNSKYHAHRALILASLAPGVSRIDGLSDAGHVRYTISALRSLGTEITTEGDTFVVRGGPYRPATSEVSVGSSGTTYYFLTGLASLATAPVTIIGQRYFQRRPITPLLAALEQMGVSLESAAGCPPIAVRNQRPAGGHVRIAGTLSQWISGLLLLAPFATGPSVIEVEGQLNERTYIDLTIRMMKDFGLHVAASPDGKRYEIEGGQQIRPADVTLPPDIGSAAFGLASVALHPADVLFRGLRTTSGAETDHPEADLLDIVAEMGLPMTTDPETGFVRVRHDDGLTLRPVRVDCRLVPDMLPVLSTLASAADGTTVLDNIAHVRLKESDRVSAMLQLNQMGGDLEVRGDSLHITGVPALSGADLSSFNDHRVLMALAIAGTRADGETRLTFPNAYRISYPRFLEEMNGIGMSMSVAPSTAREKARPKVPASGTGTPARVAKTRIGDWVRRWARERPDDPAVIGLDAANTGESGERQWTWRQLDTEADKVASLLLELGVAPGEAVACQLPNVLEFTALALACTRIGAVITPLMPIFRQREMSFMLGRARARVIVVSAEFRGRNYPAEVAAVAAPGELPLQHVIVLGEQEARGVRGNLAWHSYEDAVGRQRPDRAALDARAPKPDDFAQLLFTSGTSGEPKGVLQRMDSLTRAAAMEIRHLGLNAGDRIYIPSPLAHQTGFLYGMWLAFLLGVPQLLQQHWDAAAALSLLRRHHGTFTQAATPFLSDLLDLVEKTGERPEDLRIFVATGAAVPRAMAERATRALDTAVCGAWGTTETCLGALAAPTDEPAKVWGTDGRALNGVRLRITDDDGNVLAAGVEGNFEVKSDCLFDSYLDRPDLTAEVLTADGWYRSGDLAVIDEAGFVRISGRVKDVINRGGEKVPVAEIEQLLHTHPKVKDVAIVAMPDPRLGERACAFVQSADSAGADEDLGFEEMRRFLDDAHVAKQYWPERLEIIDELPRTQTGKVQKFVLRERIRTMIEDEAR
jgi:3-phosphoshikimate 1-carboxyvinyltransferase